MKAHEFTIAEAQKALAERKISAVELTKECLNVIDKKDPELHAFLEVYADDAIRTAESADQKIKDGDATPLTGIPFGIKDNILIKGKRTTAGSKILEQYRASYDATVITKLKAHNAVFIGKTNLDEFAMGSSTENSAFGPTRNPNDLSRVPGGSSGGSAAAVAAHLCVAALGSDTGGSIRQPAGFCGVVGLKPTYGAVSRYGLIALASSLDQIGPIAKTVEDAEVIFQAISGHDRLDATSLPEKSHPDTLPDVQNLNIGIPSEYFDAPGLSPKVKNEVQKAVSWFEKKGAKITPINLPHSPYALAVYYVLLPSEASANLARFDGIRYGYAAPDADLWEQYRRTRGEGFGAEPIRRMMLGAYALSAGYYDAYYRQARRVQALIRTDFEQAFSDIDVMLTPVSPSVAFKIGEKSDDPVSMYAEDMFMVPVNIAGLPALSLPCGQVDNLPVGMQIIAPWRREDILLKLGKFFETNYTK